MESIRVTGDHESQLKKGRCMQKIEDIAMDFFRETGTQLASVKLIWTRTDINEGDEMNDMGEKETELSVRVQESHFM